jgi:hypothetical protein
LQSCASPALSLISQKDCLSHALSRRSRVCKIQALGHYKICTICRNIFQLFAGNNAVDFFTRYISAGAAPGCLGIMSVCIEQKIKTRVCAPRTASSCSPIAAFARGSLSLSAVQFGGCFSSMACFFYRFARINCANSAFLMEMLPLCLFL